MNDDCQFCEIDRSPIEVSEGYHYLQRATRILLCKWEDRIAVICKLIDEPYPWEDGLLVTRVEIEPVDCDDPLVSVPAETNTKLTVEYSV